MGGFSFEYCIFVTRTAFITPLFQGFLQITVLGFRTEVMRSFGGPSVNSMAEPYQLISYKKRSPGFAVYSKRDMFNSIESNRNFDGVATYGKRFFDDFKKPDYDTDYMY